MQKHIIARLRLLSAEQKREALPEKNVQIEKWLSKVNQHSEQWGPSTPSKLSDARARKLAVLERQDSGLESASVSGISSATQTFLHLDRRSCQDTPVPSRSKSFSRLDLPVAVRVYRKSCRRLRILPLRRVLGQFGRSRIILSDLCMSLDDVRATCRGLMHETSASYLDISGNSLGACGCGYVLQMLARNQDFKELHVHVCFKLRFQILYGTFFDTVLQRLAENCLTGAGIWSVLKYFQTYRVITVLDISGNRLTDRDGIVVAQIIKISPQLRVLHVHHNEFRDLGGKAIGSVIGATNGLQELDLSWNHLRQRGAIGLAKGLENNASLGYVNLGWNGFGFEGCVALSDALRQNTCIEKLDISCNRIHPPALLELMKGLLHNKVLKILILDRNPITPSFATVLLEGIQRAPDMALEELSLRGIVVDRDFQGICDNIRQERNFRVEYETSLPVTCRNRDDMMKEIETRNDYNIEPLRMLYLLKERNRAQDFFHKINKDHDSGLTPDELSMLFKESGIPVSRYIIDKIMSFMDTDKDGKIDLGEFLIGDKKIKKISRDYARTSVGDGAHYSRYSRTFRKAHIQQPTSRLKVEETQNYLSPIASLTPSPASSRRSSINNP
ncbi:leucine-rich repeat-containing protein 74A-like [Mercenaria mercenaria]|uniref:leucine-rich repeat-containing protein 74A-like n=1 Tax=Mercenaria mercenaria TaxID=6596 RepID=UPI00234E58AB|nr:leucine-rich repeat-containing protein 74A-like [Mercenaria mercenaria]